MMYWKVGGHISDSSDKQLSEPYTLEANTLPINEGNCNCKVIASEKNNKAENLCSIQICEINRKSYLTGRWMFVHFSRSILEAIKRV